MTTESRGSEANKHLEFKQTIEGVLLNSIGSDLTPELKGKLLAQGLDVSKPLLPAYPAEDFHRWIRTASAALYPSATEAEALRSFGRRSISGLMETLLGKALKVTFGLLGPMRSLQRATRAFRNNNNYIEVQTHQVAFNKVELVFNEVYGLPTYYQGVLEAAGVVTGGRNFQVELQATEGRGARYLVFWEE